MSTNRILLLAFAGAAIGSILYRYLNTEKGKEFLDTATDSLKDLTNKATDYAKSTLGGLTQEKNQFQEDSVNQTSAY
jgi:hypothetical protein